MSDNTTTRQSYGEFRTICVVCSVRPLEDIYVCMYINKRNAPRTGYGVWNGVYTISDDRIVRLGMEEWRKWRMRRLRRTNATIEGGVAKERAVTLPLATTNNGANFKL